MSATDLKPERWRHELKNQIGIVLGFSELLLLDMQRDDPRRGDVEEIISAAGRALELVKAGSVDAHGT
jgi:signal transduction histidine kinase